MDKLQKIKDLLFLEDSDFLNSIGFNVIGTRYKNVMVADRKIADIAGVIEFKEKLTDVPTLLVTAFVVLDGVFYDKDFESLLYNLNLLKNSNTINGGQQVKYFCHVLCTNSSLSDLNKITYSLIGNIFITYIDFNTNLEIGYLDLHPKSGFTLPF